MNAKTLGVYISTLNTKGEQDGGWHTYHDMGMRWTGIANEMPEPYTHLVEVPGRDGVLDLSDVLSGYTRYKTRTLKLSFDSKDLSYDEWAEVSSKIANRVHGKRCRFILDTDINYYYEGRSAIQVEKESTIYSTLTISVDAFPYKIEVASSLEPWIWDNFDFESGVIREVEPLNIQGTRTVSFPSSKMPVSPKFYTLHPGIKVSQGEVTKTLAVGATNVFHGIVLHDTEAENKLKFQGFGVVEVDYRGGRL